MIYIVSTVAVAILLAVLLAFYGPIPTLLGALFAVLLAAIILILGNP